MSLRKLAYEKKANLEKKKKKKTVILTKAIFFQLYFFKKILSVAPKITLLQAIKMRCFLSIFESLYMSNFGKACNQAKIFKKNNNFIFFLETKKKQILRIFGTE
jgi:hypothetical protein